MKEHKVEAVIISKEERNKQKESEGKVLAILFIPALIVSLLYAFDIVGPYSN